jgi:hypothetical protein
MAEAFVIKMPNLQRRVRQLRNLTKAQKIALVSVVNLGALNVLRDSKTIAPSVPIDTSALINSGRVEPMATALSARIVAGISYGGVSAPPFNKFVDYADIVHDDLSAVHDKPSTAGAKFVSTHLDNRKKQIQKDAIAVMDAANKKTFTGK